MTLTKTKVNKRELILSEAAKLFKDRGFGATGMRDIAEKVGMEAASMYNHIKSKDEILELICFKIADNYTTQLEDIDNQILSFQDKMKKIIKVHIDLMIDDAASVSVANNDWKYLREEKKANYKNIRKAYESSFANILEEGMRSGEFKTMNVSVALFTILSSLRWIELWYKPSRNISAIELEEELSTILLNGLNI